MRLAKRNAPLLFAQAQHFASTINIVIVNLPELFCASCHLAHNIFNTSLGRKYLMALTEQGYSALL